MLNIQALSIRLLRKATLWLGFAVSGIGLESFNRTRRGGEPYFTGVINIKRDSRPLSIISDRHQTAEALLSDPSGRYSNRVTVLV